MAANALNALAVMVSLDERNSIPGYFSSSCRTFKADWHRSAIDSASTCDESRNGKPTHKVITINTSLLIPAITIAHHAEPGSTKRLSQAEVVDTPHVGGRTCHQEETG